MTAPQPTFSNLNVYDAGCAYLIRLPWRQRVALLVTGELCVVLPSVSPPPPLPEKRGDGT